MNQQWQQKLGIDCCLWWLDVD